MSAHHRPSGNLPTPLTLFVGRRRDIAEARRLLGRSRLVTLVGVGGVGKTRLAIEIARESARAFQHGVWFVDLAGVRNPTEVAQSVATALQVPDQSSRPAVEQIAHFLAEKKLLVVLDNCEHVLDGAAVLAEELLGALPGLRLLATSREALGFGGEQILEVQPLRIPDPDSCPPPAALEAFDATAMFLDRARAVLPGFEATEANSMHIARLCVALDGLPLAIELAASRLRTLSVEQIVERLADRFELLTGGSRTARSRQRTLRGLIGWSYDLCSPRQQLMWQRLTVFSGSFDLAAVEGVCGDSELPASGLLDLLDDLVAQSVVVVEGRRSAEPPRYRMLETIRTFGLEMLKQSGAEDELRWRHCAYYLGVAEHMADEQWGGPEQAEGLHALRLCHSNLRSALEWSAVHSTRDSRLMAHRLAVALRFHWCMDGFLSEGRRWLDRILQLPPEDAGVHGRTLWVAGWVAVVQGDHAIASERLAAAARIAEDIDDDLLRAHASSLQGTVALFAGDLDAAVEIFDRALRTFANLHDDSDMLFTMFQLAVALTHSDNVRAQATARAAVETAALRGEKLCRSYAMWALGYSAWTDEDWDAAARFTREGLSIQREYNDPIGSSLMIELLAWISAAQGDIDRAARLLGAVRTQWHRVGSTITFFGPQLAREHARCEERVAAALPPGRRESLTAEGARWDLHRSLAEVLGEKSPTVPSATNNEDRPALTPREQEVAELVADGMSNREIAARLVVSKRTVDGHVEHILTKLGFTSRTQVAAWVAGQPNQQRA